MVMQLKITLEQAEYSALLKAAMIELRNPADQARFFLRQELEWRGLLHAQTQTAQPESRGEVQSREVSDVTR